jgi:hypothetical protein
VPFGFTVKLTGRTCHEDSSVAARGQREAEHAPSRSRSWRIAHGLRCPKVRGEMGFNVRITGLIGKYTAPNIRIANNDVNFDQSSLSSTRRKLKPASWLRWRVHRSAWTGLLRAVELSLIESQWRRLRDVINSRQQAQPFSDNHSDISVNDLVACAGDGTLGAT